MTLNRTPTHQNPHAPSLRARIMTATAVLAGLWGATASAASYTGTWTQSAIGGTNNWSSSANWSTDPAAPTAGGSTTSAVTFFANATTALPSSGAIDSTNDLSGAYLLNSLVLNGRANTAGNTVSLAGGALQFDGTSPTVSLAGTNNTGTLAYTISNNLVLNQNTAISGNGTGSFAFSGPISGGGKLTKSGSSSLSLSGINTFNGGIAVNAGTVTVSGASAIGAGAVTLGGGTLTLGATGNYGNNVTVTSNSTLGGPSGTGSAIDFGALRVAGQLTITSTSGVNNPNFRFSSTTLTGNTTFNLNTAGSGMNASNPNLALENVTIDPTTVASGSTTTLSFTMTSGATRTRYMQVSGVISDGASDKKLGLRLQNPSTSKPQVILTGINTYTGRTQVSGGALYLHGGSLAISNILIDGGTLAGGAANAANGGSNGTIHYLIDGGSSTPIQITGGSLDLRKLILDLSAVTPTLDEYVIADKAVGSAFLTGTQFAAVNGLETDWSIDYDGTPSHPNSIVLVVPEPASLGLAAMAAGGVLRRRRQTRR